MLSVWFIVAIIVTVFAIDIGRRWWDQNEWKRRWHDPPDDR